MPTSKHVFLDFETWSPRSVTEVGAHKYASHPQTKIVAMSWSTNSGRHDQPIKTVTKIPKDPPFPLDDDTTFHAHNAQFEIENWKELLPWPLPKKWKCSAARAAYNGLPRSLKNAGRVANCTFQKSPTGERVLAKLQKQGELNDDDMKILVDYNAEDVLSEMDLEYNTIAMPPHEEALWQLDCRINSKGILIDRELLRKAMGFVEWYKHMMEKEVKRITGYKSSQRDKLLGWFRSKGLILPDMTAPTLKAYLPKLDGDMEEVIRNRIDLSSAGVKKFEAIKAGLMADDRLRGSLMFYGASTGRWSSLRVQIHNLARGDPKRQRIIIKMLMAEDYFGLASLEMPFAEISNAIRGFILGPLTVADYNAIEARVLAWMADEKWLLRAFREGRDPYVEMAADIFGIPISRVTEKQRFVGKTVILGAGYGMGGDTFDERIGPGSIISGAEVIEAYRNKNRRIKDLWYQVEDAYIQAIETGKAWMAGKCRFEMKGRHLHIRLPSGRDLIYRDAHLRMGMTPWGQKKKQMCFINNYGAYESTWGGKVVENIDQAISRDIMGNGMLRCEEYGMETLFTVHDEVVVDGKVPVDELEEALCDVEEWAAGIPLKAKGFTSDRYEKR